MDISSVRSKGLYHSRDNIQPLQLGIGSVLGKRRKYTNNGTHENRLFAMALGVTFRSVNSFGGKYYFK